MAQKQHQVEMPKQVQQQARRPDSDLIDEKEEGWKRPFTPHLPSLIQRAAQSPQSITPDEAAHLQRTVGNQALGRMLRVQAKLTLGSAGDKYEQEADTVAKQVMQNISAPKPKSVQRQEEDEELQAKPFTLNLPHFSFLQRKEEEDELQMKPATEGGAIASGLESQIQSAKGGGRPLSTNTQSSMGNAFNADFSGVRIHTGDQSNRLNQSIQARAFTTGQDIFFRDGAYNPDNSAGQELLAHELTHTIQQGVTPKQIQPSRNPFLLGGLGFVSPHQIQRARALSKTNQPTYQADADDDNKVRVSRVRGKRRTGHKIDRYKRFEVADEAAANAPNYYKVTTAGKFHGEFVYQPNYSPINDSDDDKVFTAHTHIKTGKNTGTDWEEARPGDMLDVTGETEENTYYIGKNWRVYEKTGSVRQDTVKNVDDGLDAPGDNMEDAATIEEDTAFYAPLDEERGFSVGINGRLRTLPHSGESLEVDFNAEGIDASGNNSLLFAEHDDDSGYIEKNKVRKISDSTTSLQQQQGQANVALPQVTTAYVVTHSTKLRQRHKHGNEPITLKATYALKPGDILEPTGESRRVLKEDRMWATEMKWQGHILGMVDVEKSTPLSDDQKTALKLNTSITGVKAQNALQHVLVTADTHLRDLGKRQYTFATGEKLGDELKKDSGVYVDFSIRGVDKQFDDGWIFAQTSDGSSYGYIREEKVTNPAKEGEAKTVGGKKKRKWWQKEKEVDFSGSEIPGDNKYLHNKNTRRNKRGDLITPDADQAVATSSHYYHLENQRTGAELERLSKEQVTLVSSESTNVDPPDKTAVVLKKAHLRTRIKNSNNNFGVSDNKTGDALTPGDKLQVNLNSAGMYKDGDTGWHYAKKTHQLGYILYGYIRASSVRESSVQQLKDETQQETAPDRYLSAYVSGKTHLRDTHKKEQEKKRAGDQIQVNFSNHPDGEDFAVLERDRWFRVKSNNEDEPRYIREHKVTIQFSKPEDKPPQSSSGKLSETAYEALKLLTGSVVGVNFNLRKRTDSDLEDVGLLHLKKSENSLKHGGEDYNTAIAGIAGGLSGLMGTVEGLIDVFGSGRNWKQRMLGVLKTVQSGLAGVAMSAWGANTIYGLKDSRLTDENEDVQKKSSSYKAYSKSGEVMGWAFGIANAIKAIKGLYLSIYSFVTNRKKMGTKKVGAFKSILETGLAGVKAAKFVADLFDHKSAGALAVSVPFIGVAVDMANIVLSAFKTHRGRMAGKKAKSRLDGDHLKQNVIDAFNNQEIERVGDPEKGDAKHLFWKESRGVRSFNTGFTKTAYLRLNPKIMFAIRNKAQLDKRELRANDIHTRSPRYINSDYYQVVDADGEPTYSVVAIIDGNHIEITSNAEKAIREYELVSKVQEVSKKKKSYGYEGITKGVINLIGDVLNMGGVTAMAGTLVKGVTAAIDSGFNFARFINKQMDNKAGKKLATHLKYRGKVKGTDKSQNKKKREYYDHAIFIMQEIGELATPEKIVSVGQEDQQTLEKYKSQYNKVHDHIDMTGVHTGLFYDYAGKPKEQVDLLVEALGER